MSIPDQVVAITDATDSLNFVVDESLSIIQKSQVASIDVVEASVLINMSSGKTYKIWNWEKETELGATSATNLAELISGLINA
jgi:hypothetical protein